MKKQKVKKERDISATEETFYRCLEMIKKNVKHQFECHPENVENEDPIITLIIMAHTLRTGILDVQIDDAKEEIKTLKYRIKKLKEKNESK